MEISPVLLETKFSYSATILQSRIIFLHLSPLTSLDLEVGNSTWDRIVKITSLTSFKIAQVWGKCQYSFWIFILVKFWRCAEVPGNVCYSYWNDWLFLKFLSEEKPGARGHGRKSRGHCPPHPCAGYSRVLYFEGSTYRHKDLFFMGTFLCVSLDPTPKPVWRSG